MGSTDSMRMAQPSGVQYLALWHWGMGEDWNRTAAPSDRSTSWAKAAELQSVRDFEQMDDNEQLGALELH